MKGDAVTTPVNPYLPVPPPQIVLPKYGLYAASTVIDMDHGVWEYGIVFDDSDNCTQGGLWQACCGKFVNAPVEVTRNILLTIIVTATPALGGGALITAQAEDSWTGPGITPINVTVGALPVAVLTSDGPAVQAGTLLAGCGTTQDITVTAVGETVTGEIVIVADTDPDIPCSGQAVLTLTVAVPMPTNEKVFDESTFSIGDPFVVYDGRTCPGKTEAELKTSALNRLQLSEMRQVEQMFWRGPNQPQLSDPSVTIVHNPAEPVSPAMGVALLEACLADSYLGVGMIHAPRYTAGLFSRELQIAYDLGVGPALKTSIGTNWVFGAGYPRTGPDGTTPPAGQSWIYATGQIVIRRSPVVSNATRDRLTGCVTGLAERTVVLAVQCGVRCAALVDFNRCDCPVPTP
jgi:hypothetical protein